MVFLINGIPVLVIECKNASKDEAIALGVDQIRRYHNETPEVMVPEMLFTATEAIGFAYGATWSLVRRNIFNWKHEEVGNLEAKVKSFCDVPHLLRLLKEFILFAEKDEELQKYILRQHQTAAVDRVVTRALDPKVTRGLVWHTQGSGKTYTMIKAAELLFKANEAQKPTILLMIDRNELEDQMLKNLAALGMANVAHANSIAALNKLLDEKGQDYRGIVVTMIHKFRDMPARLNTRKNIFVLIDEAHRTTGGDLGNFLMAGLPNASFIGFTGTPVDKTAYGKGTFKTFGLDDDKGYLHKYSIAESIEDGTTLPLYYNLAPNEMRVPHDIMEKEFLALAETEGIADIEELNKILDRAVNLKNFLKGRDRVNKVAQYVADHYRENVEPLGYKAFLVGVDREACALYKEALDAILPSEYSEIVYTGNNNDPAHLKKWHLEPTREKQIRKSFTKIGEWPKILIVTEKLLTGFDAPILYAMYLDKPMRDHTLLQAIARVNRPYENEAQEMVKPHGFVLDFVGIFDKLEKALAFDSDEVNAIVKDLGLLKQLFKAKMESKAPVYLTLIIGKFDDKDVDNLIEHFRDQDRRKEFFKEYKEIEMLYEIISPDAFLRPFIEQYATLSSNQGAEQPRQCKLTDDGIGNPEAVSRKVAEAFTKFPNWRRSEAELRELRKQVTFAVLREEDDVEKRNWERRRTTASDHRVSRQTRRPREDSGLGRQRPGAGLEELQAAGVVRGRAVRIFGSKPAAYAQGRSPRRFNRHSRSGDHSSGLTEVLENLDVRNLWIRRMSVMSTSVARDRLKRGPASEEGTTRLRGQRRAKSSNPVRLEADY